MNDNVPNKGDKVLRVSPAEVMVANLLLLLDKEDGIESDPAVVAIANAETENDDVE